MVTFVRAMKRHLPYGIMQCYLPPNAGKHTQVKLTRTKFQFAYPRGMEGWVDLDVSHIPRWFTCPQTVTHPCSSQFRPGVKPI